MRHPARREQWQLLPAHQAVHKIDGCDARFDEILRQLADGGVDWDTVDAQTLASGNRRPTVHRLADAVEYAAKEAGADREMQRLGEKPDADVAQTETNGRFQHFDHHGVLIERGDAAELWRLAFAQDLYGLVQARLDIAPQEQQWTFDGGGGALHRQLRPHGAMPFRAQPSPPRCWRRVRRSFAIDPRRSPRPCAASGAAPATRQSPATRRRAEVLLPPTR